MHGGAEARAPDKTGADIGEKLARAHKLDQGARPPTKRYNDAWGLADEAVALLGWLITRQATLRPSIEAAGKRITGTILPGPERPPERRKLGEVTA